MINFFAPVIDIGGQIEAPFWQQSLNDLLNNFVGLMIVLAAVVAFFFLLYGGIRWITSQGDKERMTAAQNTITAALVGLIVVFAAWAIMKLLEAFFGIDILSELKIPSVSE